MSLGTNVLGNTVLGALNDVPTYGPVSKSLSISTGRSSGVVVSLGIRSLIYNTVLDSLSIPTTLSGANTQVTRNNTLVLKATNRTKVLVN